MAAFRMDATFCRELSVCTAYVCKRASAEFTIEQERRVFALFAYEYRPESNFFIVYTDNQDIDGDTERNRVHQSRIFVENRSFLTRKNGGHSHGELFETLLSLDACSAFSNPTVPQFSDCQLFSVGLGCIGATFHCPDGCKGSEIRFLDWLPNGFSIFRGLASRHCTPLSVREYLRDADGLSGTRRLYRTLLRSFSYPNESCPMAFRYTFSGRSCLCLDRIGMGAKLDGNWISVGQYGLLAMEQRAWHTGSVTRWCTWHQFRHCAFQRRYCDCAV